jgi:hypothetical protein
MMTIPRDSRRVLFYVGSGGSQRIHCHLSTLNGTVIHTAILSFATCIYLLSELSVRIEDDAEHVKQCSMSLNNSLVIVGPLFDFNIHKFILALRRICLDSTCQTRNLIV